MRYVRKPIEIDALLWDGMEGTFEVIEEWMTPAPVDRVANDSLVIHTMNAGTKTARFGDYVCRDVHDRTVFVLAPEGFKLMYVPVDLEEEL